MIDLVRTSLPRPVINIGAFLWTNFGPAPRIGEAPMLTELDFQRWEKAVTGSRLYLEYGSGGSTVCACRIADAVLSVETDQRFGQLVVDHVRSLRLDAKLTYFYADIGLTAGSARPLFTRMTPTRREAWSRYAKLPWEYLERTKQLPDVVFVDGRFRVSAVLESFLRLPDSSNCTFLMDDFVARKDDYAAVLDFAEDIEWGDRMIQFKQPAALDRDRCQKTLEDHRFRWV
jgi:hypothetical protein